MDRCARGRRWHQAAALTDLRTYLLRAALFTLNRAQHQVGHLGSSPWAVRRLALGGTRPSCARTAAPLRRALLAPSWTAWIPFGGFSGRGRCVPCVPLRVVGARRGSPAAEGWLVRTKEA